MPKIKTESVSPGDQTWLGSLHGLEAARTLTLDPADFTAKTRDRVIPSGTALAISSKKVVPYDQAGGGDSAKLVGFLLTDQPSDRGRLAVPVVDHVRVKIANLPDTGFAVPAAGNDLTSCVYIPKGA